MRAASVRAVVVRRAATICLVCLAAPARAQGPDPRRLAQAVDAAVRPLVEAEQLSGSLLVAEGDRVLVERSWGFANRELRVPNRDDTRFCVASITKPMTMIVALQLIHEGKVGYTDTLNKWIADFPNGNRITVEHLLRHRAGIPHRVTTPKDETQPVDAASMVDYARGATLMFEPGTKSSYSSAGYSVLARVLELASGESYGALLHERLFDRFGMTSSSSGNARTILPGRAASYVPILGGVENAPLVDTSFLVGAGSVWSTPRDLHRLLRAVAKHELGESVFRSTLDDGGIHWNGSSNGFRAWADYDTTTQVSVVFTGNLHTGAPDLLRTATTAILRQEKIAALTMPEFTPVQLREDELRRFEGLYDVRNNPRLELRVAGDALSLNGWTLVPTSGTSFFSLRDYSSVEAVLGPDGTVVRLDWTYAGAAFPCPRVGDLPQTAAR